MIYHSILFKNADYLSRQGSLLTAAPEFFVDLNLEPVIATITHGREEYDLKPFFYTILTDKNTILYRHEIMQDIEKPAVLRTIHSFVFNVHLMRQNLTQSNKMYYPYQKERLFLEAVEMYCRCVPALSDHFSKVDLQSPGLLSFHDYLTQYVHSESFTTLSVKTKQLIENLSAIKYAVLIRDDCVTVCYPGPETDYSVEVEETFQKFRQAAVKDYQLIYPATLDMNHIEAQILEKVAQLYPEIFGDVRDFYRENQDYLDASIALFEREIQFYLAYMEYIATLKKAGLQFCYPQISSEKNNIYNEAGFDLALAHKLVSEKSQVVTNDFYLQGAERIIIVTGPNQGGKTTFARTFGQLHYLACIGCPTPGNKARLFLFDHLFTHFEQEEDITRLQGKLENDLIRMHDILNRTTPNSILILNEILTSTTLQDAIFLSQKLMEKIIEFDLLGVWVTFIDELASFSEKTVSMVSTVEPDNPALRTFKIIRKPAQGLAYALSIAEKYRLTYSQLLERIQS